MQRVVIIDYGSGNLRSAKKAFERAARDAGLNACIDLVRQPDELRRAEKGGGVES